MDGGPAPERRPPAGVLTDAAVALLARYGWLLVALGWVATRAAMAFVKQTAPPTPLATLFKMVSAQTAGDLRHYYDMASAWVSGQVPYRDVDLEYPPGALVLFALPRLLASGFDGYALAFGAEMLVFDALALVLLARTTIRLGGRDGESAAQVRARAVLAGLGYLALTTPMGELLFKRFDVALAALLAAFVFCVVAGARARCRPSCSWPRACGSS
jgi:hypothetical protein